MNMHEVTIAYGMTETSPVSTQCATDDPVERRVSTVGQVLPHIEIKIIDAEGKAVPRGETGEFCTRGYSVMKGYWNDEEKTAEAIDEGGWMHTGDLATMDDEGYVNIVGRLKDMVIRGGENVYPREIEEFLYRHPKIQDVQVIGVPDPEVRRGDLRLDQAARRPEGDGRRDPRVLQGPDRPLQDPALHRVRRRLPDDHHRQDPEVRDARADRRQARAEGAEDGVSRSGSRTWQACISQGSPSAISFPTATKATTRASSITSPT